MSFQSPNNTNNSITINPPNTETIDNINDLLIHIDSVIDAHDNHQPIPRFPALIIAQKLRQLIQIPQPKQSFNDNIAATPPPTLKTIRNNIIMDSNTNIIENTSHTSLPVPHSHSSSSTLNSTTLDFSNGTCICM